MQEKGLEGGGVYIFTGKRNRMGRINIRNKLNKQLKGKFKNLKPEVSQVIGGK
jgi:hypothetical protein